MFFFRSGVAFSLFLFAFFGVRSSLSANHQAFSFFFLLFFFVATQMVFSLPPKKKRICKWI